MKTKSTLSEKDKKLIFYLLNELADIYSDFYITKNNLRLYVKENLQSLIKLLNKGDKILFDEEGIAIIIGYAEKSPRKYVKILGKNEQIIDKLIKNINWNFSEELYCKIKENNPIKKILLKNRWKYFGARGKECLLKREKIEISKIGEKYVDQNKD